MQMKEKVATLRSCINNNNKVVAKSNERRKKNIAHPFVALTNNSRNQLRIVLAGLLREPIIVYLVSQQHMCLSCSLVPDTGVICNLKEGP